VGLEHSDGNLAILEKYDSGSAVFVRYKDSRSERNYVAVLTQSSGRWKLESKIELD
jgi:hypothetical protein